ncbi:MAG: hypothetical protein H7177_16940 [Rhizobacter sp.]|nr:hypothetical protein [Bacteriovorax sp.]
MKNALYIALIATATVLSVSVQAIPPNPPTPAKDAPAVIICKDANALTSIEIEELNADTDKLISFDSELREVCFKK